MRSIIVILLALTLCSCNAHTLAGALTLLPKAILAVKVAAVTVQGVKLKAGQSCMMEI